MYRALHGLGDEPEGGYELCRDLRTRSLDRSITQAGEDTLLWINASPSFMRGVVPKGSVAVHGVSLTVADLDEIGFLVCLIPHTWAHTTLSRYSVGEELNLEADLIGKHVVRYLEASGR